MLAEIAVLLVSELVTNSVRHARLSAPTPLRLHGEILETTVRLELWDSGTDGDVGRRRARALDEIGGFGLELVEQLSRAWGVERDAHGTTVWLELTAAVDAMR